MYTALDPATAILEVGVHKGLAALDVVPHTLVLIRISDPTKVHVADVSAVNQNWLRPGAVSAGQQAFGDELISRHPLILLPSVVSTHSWNLLIDVGTAATLFKLAAHEAFALDPRLNPPERRP